MKKEKFKRVRVLCSEDSLRDVLAALLSGTFKSEVPAAKNEAALDFRRVAGDDPYEKPIKRLSAVAKYAGWKYTSVSYTHLDVYKRQGLHIYVYKPQAVRQAPFACRFSEKRQRKNNESPR